MPFHSDCAKVKWNCSEFAMGLSLARQSSRKWHRSQLRPRSDLGFFPTIFKLKFELFLIDDQWTLPGRGSHTEGTGSHGAKEV